MEKKRFTVKDMAMVGVLAALVFAASSMSIPIPTAVDNTRLHLGNVMCLLSGFLVGPVPGGLAAGIGSLFFDLTNPLYIKDAPFTFLFKFLMAFVCGKIAYAGNAQGLHVRRNLGAGTAGAFTYVALYLSKNFIMNLFFSRLAMEVALMNLAQKAAVSGTNAVIAVAASVPLATAIRKGLDYRKTNS